MKPLSFSVDGLAHASDHVELLDVCGWVELSDSVRQSRFSATCRVSTALDRHLERIGNFPRGSPGGVTPLPDTGSGIAGRSHSMRLKTPKIGMYMAMTMAPMMAPMTTIMSGSMRLVSCSVVASTSCVVEVRDLAEHRVQGAGVLTDGHHLHDHRREDRVLRQRAGQRLTAPHGLLDRLGGLLDDEVAAGLADDVERLQERDAGVDHRAEVAGEPGDRDLLEQLAEHGQLELPRVDALADGLVVLVLAPPEREGDRARRSAG